MPEEVLRHRAFTLIGGRTFTWADLVVSAQVWGEWDKAVAAAVAAERAIERARAEGALGGAQVEDTARQFRYEHQLLSADELDKWLDFRGLDLESWLDYIHAACLSGEQVPGEVAAGSDEIRKPAWAHAVCSGSLERVGRRLAEYLAVAEAIGMPVGRATLGTEELRALEHAHSEFSSAIDHTETRRELERRQVEWTRVRIRQLSSEDEQVVRELALCVRADGRPIDDVAITAGAPIKCRYLELGHVDEPLRSKLLGAHVGELLGPLRYGADHLLVEVVEKHPPSFDDPELVQRARAYAVERTLLSEVSERVSFHELP
ncbi:hypothetical protein AB0N09_15195 [Streptomyces erythrochromogenes]|uniref:hypothetical protein n=1 Tax=Streptomyces erythrochromogenes TaxID=285574 RepID=UPI0034187A79